MVRCGLYGSNWLVQHILQMLDQIEGSEELFLKPFLNHFCSVAGCVFLLKETNVVKKNTVAIKGVYLVCTLHYLPLNHLMVQILLICWTRVSITVKAES